jgi:hypothetical protein
MDLRKCQTSAASPAEPGELLFLFSPRTGLRNFDDVVEASEK